MPISFIFWGRVNGGFEVSCIRIHPDLTRFLAGRLCSFGNRLGRCRIFDVFGTMQCGWFGMYIFLGFLMCRTAVSFGGTLPAWQTNGNYLSIQEVYNIYQKNRSHKNKQETTNKKQQRQETKKKQPNNTQPTVNI